MQREFQSTHPVRGGTCVPLHRSVFRDYFNPPTPCGVGRDDSPSDIHTASYFNPPTPCGVGRQGELDAQFVGYISIHPPRAGWDFSVLCLSVLCHCISIHPPRAGWDVKFFIHDYPSFLISIHPPRAGWDFSRLKSTKNGPISIHPPRAGWDGSGRLVQSTRYYFNPPTPCGVGRSYYMHDDRQWAFQSTHPVRGGTKFRHCQRKPLFISIHPPRAGWDSETAQTRNNPEHFNPPTPCGVGRFQVLRAVPGICISIHPPRAGWDGSYGHRDLWGTYFNPPTPCGVGPRISLSALSANPFQSTHPVRGGTAENVDMILAALVFQSTHPVRGGTLRPIFQTIIAAKFQSTHPVRGGTESSGNGN